MPTLRYSRCHHLLSSLQANRASHFLSRLLCHIRRVDNLDHVAPIYYLSRVFEVPQVLRLRQSLVAFDRLGRCCRSLLCEVRLNLGSRLQDVAERSLHVLFLSKLLNLRLPSTLVRFVLLVLRAVGFPVGFEVDL